mmetsp:Transcript_74897/g.207362  ORF Transcript_74897/g.207362 Transcript_74897/m.207362 type:complete len:248 (-) Transcript_74897:155-898(-)
MEAHRGPAPPVPRAPRAAPKAQSAGALNRDMWSRRPGSASRSCLPRDESPCAQGGEHRRVAALNREVELKENQAFEMGPQRRPPTAPRRDFSRGHALGKEGALNKGMPWAPTAETDHADPEQAPNAARRSVLRHEMQAADQALEWVPKNGARARSMDAEYGRINAFKKADGEAFDFLPGAHKNASVPIGVLNRGRRNVLMREHSSLQSLEGPRANSFDGGVPYFARDNRLARENPVFRGAGASVLAS